MVWSTDLAKFILDFVDYGVLVLIVLIVVEIFKAIGGGKKEGEEPKTGEEGGLLDKWKKKRKNRARREKTKLLNETILEQKEIDLLKGAVESSEKALELVTGVLNKKEIKDAAERDAIVSSLDKLKSDLEAAKGEYRKVKKKTWRQEKGFDKLLEVLEEKEGEVKAEGFDDLKKWENHIIVLHQECADELNDVLKFYGKMSGEIKILKDIPVSAFPAHLKTGPYATGFRAEVETIQGNVNEAKYKLTKVYDKQREVYTEITAIMSKVKEIW